MSPLAAAVVALLVLPPSSSSRPMSTSASSAPLAFLPAVDVVRRRRRLRLQRRPPPPPPPPPPTTTTAMTTIAMTTTTSIRSLRPSSSLFAVEEEEEEYDDGWGGEEGDEYEYEYGDDDDDRPADDDDPRVSAMRSMLESSWDVHSMGRVPTSPRSASRIVAECVREASSSNVNVMTIDIRLPGYDVLEGGRLYDALAMYEFCSCLSDDMRERGLARKCLVLTMDGRGADEIGRTMRYRRGRKTKGGGGTTTTTASSSSSSFPEEEEGSLRRRATFVAPSHRLWSAIGRRDDDDDLDPNDDGGFFGPDTFDEIVRAVDENSSLEHDEDALILISPHNLRHVVVTRRILARYGRTRTIIVVNPRFEDAPREMDDAVLVYGMLPLVARSSSSSSGGGAGDDDDDDDDGGSRSGGAGLRAVVMKRYPRDWTVYVDAYGDGFVEAAGRGGKGEGTRDNGGSEGGGGFPSPEWIARRVQAHVEGLSRRRDLQ